MICLSNVKEAARLLVGLSAVIKMDLVLETTRHALAPNRRWVIRVTALHHLVVVKVHLIGLFEKLLKDILGLIVDVHVRVLSELIKGVEAL
jgi:hypothetical protein